MLKKLLTFIHEKCPKDTSAWRVAHIRDLKILQAIPTHALCAYVVDFASHRIFTYPAQMSGAPNETLNDVADTIADFIPDDERDKMVEHMACLHSFIINEIPDLDWRKIVVFEDFHVSMVGLRMLVTQKFFPVDVGVQGEVTAWMFVVTPSSNNSFGNLTLLHDGRAWLFNPEAQSFIEKAEVAISDSEMKMMVLSRMGLTVECISAWLHVSVDTVKTLRKRVYKKLGVDCLQRAIAMMDTYALWRAL